MLLMYDIDEDNRWKICRCLSMRFNTENNNLRDIECGLGTAAELVC